MGGRQGNERFLFGSGGGRGFTVRYKMTDSQKLLAEYANNGSEQAFRELVSRYINFVYATALRLVGGDTHLAEDVAQTVFINLARAGRKLSSGVMLGGWLHQSTYHVATKAVRGERRRQKRERETVEMNTLQQAEPEDLRQVRPILDEALTKLDQEDRAAIVLRFFEQRDFRTVAEAMGSSEDAARMRVHRALEKLHTLLKRQGATLSLAAAGTVLTTEAATAAPAGLATTICATALSGAAGAGTTLSILKIMTATKINAGIIGAVVLAGITTTLVIQHNAQAKMSAQDELLKQQAAQLEQLRADNARLAEQSALPNRNSPGELAKLRSDVTALRAQTNRLASAAAANKPTRAPASSKPKTALELQEEAREMAFSRLNYSRNWMLAFHMFANENNGKFPPDFETAAAYISNETKKMTNLSTAQFEIVYQGSLTSIKSPATTIVVREREPWRSWNGKWNKAYAFADGHSELHSSEDANFDAWEKERIVTPSLGQ